MPKFNSEKKTEPRPEESELEEIRKARLAEGDEAAYGMAERERIEAESHKEIKETREIKESEFNPDQLLTIYRLLEGKGADSVLPPDFKAPEEIKKNADRFFEAREYYLKEFEKHYQASEKLKKAGAGEGADAEFQQARWYLENAEKSYNLTLETFKKDIIGYKYRAKLKEFPEVVKLDKKEEYAKAGASVMSGITRFVINGLEREKMERLEKRKEKGMAGKLWRQYRNLDQGTRLGISAWLSGAIGMGLALAAGPGGWFLVAGVAGHRALRTLGGGALAAGLRSLGEKIIGPRFGEKKIQVLTEEAANLEKSLLNEIEKQRKLPKSEKKKIENKLWMSILVDKQAEKYGQKLREIARKEGRTRFWLTLGSGLVGGITAAGFDWYFSKPKISEMAELAGVKKEIASIESTIGGSKPSVEAGTEVPSTVGAVEAIPGKTGAAAEIAKIMEKLPIGKRGPEGAIIDYFKGNPEIAKKFGWDGIKDLKDWSGIKAHQLWLEDAKEALTKLETAERLQELGYVKAGASQEELIEAYGQMMWRIKEGSVILKPDGTIDLAEGIDYLKAVKETAKGTVEDISPIPAETPEVAIMPESGALTVEELTNPERLAGLAEQEVSQESEISSLGSEEITMEETPGIATKEPLPIQETPDIFIKGVDMPLNPLEIAQADTQAADLINKIREGKLTVNQFNNAYARELGAIKGTTPEFKANLIKTFEDLKNPITKQNAERVFKTLMRRLFAIKK